MTSKSEERLAKRSLLIDGFDMLLKQIEYFREHKEDFKLDRQVLWSDGENKGNVDPI